ncbi:MoaD/ThiS family protein [Chondrinema litorale]|uniref:MoaD/ThiS family protein n=1 Tax=Chondrinema litorale TaxID=2994555 RepID=UPI0025427E6C|nr:MoaD/ThiS family protein [Chondrinema litorale]UZR97866.1 MoaD/ThiS family protein [Chondrinema litorale]
MAIVRFTSALRRFFPDLKDTEFEGATVKETLNNIEKSYPGILSYLLDDNGALRKHVNIYLQNELIQDRQHFYDQVKEDDEIIIFQALSGG